MPPRLAAARAPPALRLESGRSACVRAHPRRLHGRASSPAGDRASGGASQLAGRRALLPASTPGGDQAPPPPRQAPSCSTLLPRQLLPASPRNQRTLLACCLSSSTQVRTHRADG